MGLLGVLLVLRAFEDLVQNHGVCAVFEGQGCVNDGMKGVNSIKQRSLMGKITVTLKEKSSNEEPSSGVEQLYIWLPAR